MGVPPCQGPVYRGLSRARGVPRPCRSRAKTIDQKTKGPKNHGRHKDNMGWSGWEKFGNLTTYEYEQTKYASSGISGGFFIEETHAPSPSDSPLYHVGCSKGPQSAHFPQSAKRPITR